MHPMARKVAVTIRYGVDDSLTVIQMPLTATFGEAMAAWAAATGLSPHDHRFREFGGARLPDAETLAARLPRGAFGLCVEVEPAGALDITFVGLPGLRASATASPDSPVADVLDQVRTSLRLGARPMCLVAGGRRLEPERTLGEQQVAVDAALAVDLLFTFTVETAAPLEFEEEEESAVLALPRRRVTCAGSDTATLLLDAGLPAAGQRVLLGGRAVPSASTLIASLPPDAALECWEWAAVVERSLPVVVQRQAAGAVRLETAWVWPSDPVAVLLAGGRGRVFLDGEAVDTRHSFAAVDVQPHSLFVVADTLALGVRDSRGRNHVVHIARSATVAELRQRLTGYEADAAFEIRSGGVALVDGARRLAEVGVVDGGDLRLLRVLPRRVASSVQTPACRVAAATSVETRKTSAAVQGPSEWVDDVATARSESVRAQAALEMSEAEMRRLEAALVRSEAEMRRLEAALVRSEAEVRRLEAVQEALRGRTAAGHGTQVGPAKEASGQQQPPPPPTELLVHVWDYVHDKRLDVSLAVPSPPTRGGVRAALAAELGVDPEQVRMRRWEGRTRSGVAAAHVWVGGRGLYADATGRTWELGQVKDMEDRNLTDDRAPFLVPGRRRSILFVKKR